MAGAISIVLKAIDKYSGVITGLNQGLELVSKAMNTIKFGSDLVVSALQSVFEVAKSLGSSFFSVGQTFETLGIRMDAVFGGGGASQRALDWATEFGAKTPLTLDEVANRLVKLKSAGFDPLDDSLGLMQKLGDTTLALGLDFDRLLNPLRKLNSGGKATFESINQLAEAGIPIYEILNDKLGMTAEQVQNIAKQNIRGKDIVFQVIDGISSRYAGAMQAAANTTAGAMSTINDIITVFQKKILDQGVWKVFAGYIVGVRDVLDRYLLGDTGKILAESWGQSLTQIGRALAVAFDPRLILVYVELAINGIRHLFEIVTKNFPSLTRVLDSPWGESTDSVQSWGKTITGVVFNAVEYVGKGINTVLEFLTGTKIMSAIEFLSQTFIKGFSIISRGIILAMSEASMFVLETLAFIGDRINDFIDSMPTKLLNYLGIDDTRIDTDMFKSLGHELEGAADSVVAGIATIEENLASMVGTLSQTGKEWRVDLEGIAAMHAAVNEAIDGIDYKPAQEAASKAVPNFDDATESLNSFAKTLGKITLDGKTFDLKASFDTDTTKADKAIDALNERVREPISLKVDADALKLREEIKEMVARTDWPTEFRGMMELFLSWILAKASGETVPLAITTA